MYVTTMDCMYVKLWIECMLNYGLNVCYNYGLHVC